LSKIVPRSQKQIAAAILTDAAVLPTEHRRGKNRKRTQAEIDHQGRVAELPCVVCMLIGEMQQGRTYIHHIRDNRLRADSHMDVLPLCFDDHQNRQGIHGDRSRLKLTGKTQAELLEITRALF